MLCFEVFLERMIDKKYIIEYIIYINEYIYYNIV